MFMFLMKEAHRPRRPNSTVAPDAARRGLDFQIGASIFLAVPQRLSLVCAENLIRVDGVNESPKLAQ